MAHELPVCNLWPSLFHVAGNFASSIYTCLYLREVSLLIGILMHSGSAGIYQVNNSQNEYRPQNMVVLPKEKSVKMVTSPYHW